MVNQVTSIEQSKRLIELGVPVEKASMVWDPNYRFDSATRQFIHTGVYDLCMKHKAYTIIKEELIPAFTIADLIAILPITCGDLHINIEEIKNSHKFIYYEGRKYIQGDGDAELQTVLFVENSLVESCVKAIEWVISNNYKMNI